MLKLCLYLHTNSNIMKNTLLIIGHPNLDTSTTSKTIFNFLSSTKEFENKKLVIRNLASLYPNNQIDILAEQEALLWAETIVLQFPFYWYSVPGILKTWIDEVFQYGFAYGRTGDKLKDKHLLLSFSTGGPQEAYMHGGRNNFEIEELLYPLKQTSNLIGTKWEEPIVSYAMVNIPGIDIDKSVIEKKAIEHAQKLYQRILNL